MSCKSTANAGTCLPVAEGNTPPTSASTPTKICPIQGGACGADGKCDGAGACRNTPGGTICQGETCASMTSVAPAKICDGSGSCVTPSGSLPIDCQTYRCAAGRCNSGCQGNGQCSGVSCSGGKCGGALRSLGAMCGANSECVSNRCVESVCCESDCTGECKTCAAPGLWGRCIDVPAGRAAVAGGCGVTVGAFCREDGRCNGAGACRLKPKGASCQASACTSSGLEVWRCDGAGICSPTTTSCGNYKCQTLTPSCFGGCDSAAQCVSGFTCLNRMCVP